MCCQRFVSLCLVWLLTVLRLAASVPQWHNSTDGRQYLIEGDQKYNWFHAFHECARLNLQLVEIDSQQKNEALIEVLKSVFGNSHNLWIGANDEFNKDKNPKRPFYAASSGKPQNFFYWSPSQPDNAGGEDEHCVHMWAEQPNFQWNDHHCDSQRFGFVCEDHYLHAIHSKTMADKQKRVQEATAKIFEEYNLQQKQQIEKLESSMKEIENRENELRELLQSVHTKLEYDVTHALAQHQREINSVIDERNRMIRNLNGELKSATELGAKKFSKELEVVKSVLDDVFKD